MKRNELISNILAIFPEVGLADHVLDLIHQLALLNLIHAVHLVPPVIRHDRRDRVHEVDHRTHNSKNIVQGPDQ